MYFNLLDNFVAPHDAHPRILDRLFLAGERAGGRRGVRASSCPRARRHSSMARARQAAGHSAWCVGLHGAAACSTSCAAPCPGCSAATRPASSSTDAPSFARRACTSAPARSRARVRVSLSASRWCSGVAPRVARSQARVSATRKGSRKGSRNDDGCVASSSASSSALHRWHGWRGAPKELSTQGKSPLSMAR